MKSCDVQLLAANVKRSFEQSGKRHILITGSKGSGKTTLAREIAGGVCAGFSSKAVARSYVLMRDNLSGEEGIIGEYSQMFGRMEPLYCGFSELGVRILHSAMEYDGAVLLDEIGYLESDALDFRAAVEELLDNKATVLTVRKENTEFILRLKSRKDVYLVDMDILRGKIGCVIMSSGHSRRFGSNKLLADFGGITLVERAILATDGVFEKRVVITRYPDVASICGEYGAECVLHDLPDRCDTIRLGLEKMKDMQGCMFVPSDQPLLRRKTVMALAADFLADKENIWRLSSGGEMGMPVVFPKKLFGELSSLTSGGGGQVIKKHPELLRLFEMENNRELLDADTPEMLRKLGDL